MNTDAYLSNLAEAFYAESNIIKTVEPEFTADFVGGAVYDELGVEISETEALAIAEQLAEEWDGESETARFEFGGRMLETQLSFSEYNPDEDDEGDFTYGSDEKWW